MSARDILVVAETNRGQLADMSLEMLGAARQLAAATGGKVVAVLLERRRLRLCRRPCRPRIASY